MESEVILGIYSINLWSQSRMYFPIYTWAQDFVTHTTLRNFKCCQYTKYSRTLINKKQRYTFEQTRWNQITAPWMTDRQTRWVNVPSTVLWGGGYLQNAQKCHENNNKWPKSNESIWKYKMHKNTLYTAFPQNLVKRQQTASKKISGRHAPTNEVKPIYP